MEGPVEKASADAREWGGTFCSLRWMTVGGGTSTETPGKEMSEIWGFSREGNGGRITAGKPA